MTITFERTSSQPILIELVVDDDASLDDVVSACRAGAFALGYHIDSIMESFQTNEEMDSGMVPLEEDY